MKNPFDRNRARHGEDPVEAALRASLREHAAQAPPADALSERIIATADSLPTAGLRPAARRGWRAFTLPAIAAAAVAAIVGGAFAIEHYHPDADGPPAAQSVSVSPPGTSTPARPQTSAPLRSQDASSAPTQANPPDTSTLHGVHIVDLTFTAADSGWGLASAQCIKGSGRCTALLRTTDGRVWQSRPNTPFSVPGDTGGCAAPCVEHIRFATDEIGYAYGPAALYITKDGARSWKRLTGGADALETLDGNVIRVSDAGGCPPGCSYAVRTAPIGSTTWRDVQLPGTPGIGDAVQLSRAGHAAYLEVYGNPAGGAPAGAVLYTSGDDGATWTNRGEPCSQGGGHGVDSAAMTTAADGAVIIGCAPRGGQAADFTITSTDAGKRFAAASRAALGSAGISLVGAASAKVQFVMSDALYRSVDGGGRWRKVQQNSSGGPLGVSYLGFQTASVGRAVTDGGRSIWTTRDAGASWTAVNLH